MKSTIKKIAFVLGSVALALAWIVPGNQFLLVGFASVCFAAMADIIEVV